MEVVDAVRALGHGEKGLAIVAFDPHDEQDLAVQLDGAGIEDGVDPQTFQQDGLVPGSRSYRQWSGTWAAVSTG